MFVLVFGFLDGAQAQTGAGTVSQTLEDIQDQLDDLADDIDDIDSDGANTQSQEQDQTQSQNVNLPLGHGGRGGGGGSKLPKTGVDAAEVGGIGTASLLAGASLIEFARRRRRNWIAPVSLAEARAVTTTAPRLGSSEGDLLLPYFPDATR
ncbi:MAG: hypothetical protein ACRDKJ_14520 [Actinomycetota bacterium]